MPLIYYSCTKSECGKNVSKFYRQAKSAPDTIECDACKEQAKKSLKAPSSATILSIDNGVQARATQVNLDVVEDIKNRSTKNFGND